MSILDMVVVILPCAPNMIVLVILKSISSETLFIHLNIEYDNAFKVLVGLAFQHSVLRVL